MNDPHLERFARIHDIKYSSFSMRDSVNMHVLYGKQKLAWVYLQLPACDILTCVSGVVTSLLHYHAFEGDGINALRFFFEGDTSKSEHESAMALVEENVPITHSDSMTLE